MTELAEDRVAAFIASYRDWEGDEDFICRTGTYNSEHRVTLYVSDLREVLDELAEHQRLLIEIDKALDERWGGVLVTDAEAMERLRQIMGRNKKEV